MKMTHVCSPLIAPKEMISSVVGIAPEAHDQISYFLRDKIYSNKIWAVVRETITNAIDEHQKFDVECPVSVGIKQDSSDYIFYVRDFAKGLDEDGVRNVFGMYGRSTKRGNNIQTGMFGLGSKAPLCYTDSFFVTSYHEGVKSVYSLVLGGGESGVSVCHIYKLDESPTNESGLEISLNIKPSDLKPFNREIYNLVRHSPYKIIYKINYNGLNSHIVNSPVVWSKEIDGIQYKLLYTKDSMLESNLNMPETHYHKFLVQMGGICYHKLTSSDLEFIVSSKNNHQMVIELPIGSMSLPISRESFESTKSNALMLEKVKSHLNDIIREDFKKYEESSIIDIFNEISASNWKKSESNLFSACVEDLSFPKIKEAKNIRSFLDDKNDMAHKDGKPVLVFWPENCNNDYWTNKMKSLIKEGGYKNCYVYGKKLKPESQILLEEDFSIVNIKKLPYPKAIGDKQNKTYVVRKRNGRHSFYKLTGMTAEKLQEFVSQIYGATTEEIIEHNKKIIETAKTKEDLKKIIIGGNSYSESCQFYTNAKSLIEDLEKLGWLRFGSHKLNEIFQQLKEKQNNENLQKEIIKKAKKYWINFNKKTIDIISKNHKHAQKINQVFEKILKEDTLRRKIIEAYVKNEIYYFYFKPFSRQEFRQIMKLKNVDKQ